MDDIPDFLKRLQNKITYYIYKTVNDDDANEYAKKDSYISSNRMYMAGANNKTCTILTILKYYIPKYI